MLKLLNIYFIQPCSWNKKTLTEVGIRNGPCKRISLEEVRAAVTKMKINKVYGPFGIVADILKAAGETGLAWTTHVCNAVVKEGKNTGTLVP